MAEMASEAPGAKEKAEEARRPGWKLPSRCALGLALLCPSRGRHQQSNAAKIFESGLRLAERGCSRDSRRRRRRRGRRENPSSGCEAVAVAPPCRRTTRTRGRAVSPTRRPQVHYPLMTLAQQVFRQGTEPTPELEKEIRATIEANDMAPLGPARTRFCRAGRVTPGGVQRQILAAGSRRVIWAVL